MVSLKDRAKRKLQKLKKTGVYLLLKVRCVPIIGAIFPLTMSKPETTQFPVEIQTQIEQVSLQPSLRIARTAREPEIKVVASENPNPEISSEGLFGQPREVRNNNSSVAKIEKTKAFLETRVGGSWNDPLNRIIRNRILEWLFRIVALFNKANSDNPANNDPTFHGFPNSRVFTNPSGPRGPRPRAFVNPPAGPQGRQYDPKASSLSMGKKKVLKSELETLLNQDAEFNEQNVKLKMEVRYPEMRKNNGAIKEALKTFIDDQDKQDIENLIDRFRRGDPNPGIGTRPIDDTILFELRADHGGRVYFHRKNDILYVAGISAKGNQKKVLNLIKDDYKKK